MLERWQKRLVLINVAVFVTVLSIFCAVVYNLSCTAFDKQLQEKLVSIADSAISSIDFEGAGGDERARPDLIVSVLPSEASPALQSMRLQWFTPDGKLDIEKGAMPITVPFRSDAGFQNQQDPEALIFSKPAVQRGQVLGYVRVGHPLAEQKQQKLLLLQSFILGLVIAGAAAAVSVSFLVRQSLKPVEESIENLKQFCADAAHELRTPITVIRTNSLVALRHPDGMRESDRDKFDAIASGIAQMEKLTEDLLALAMAEQPLKPHEEAEVETLNLNEMVSAVLESTEPGAKCKGLTIENKLNEPLNVVIDDSDLNCILRNLVDNAINYTPKDGRVTISAEASNGNVMLTIADTGIGIPKEDLPRVFERFWRADKARSYHSGGNGLGLSIVKAVVEKNDGTIACASEPGKGTSFKVQLKSARSQPNSKES